MRIIVTTIIELVPKLASICLLLLLVYSCYFLIKDNALKTAQVDIFFQVLWMFASFAVHEFGVVKYGKRIGPTANFETFAAALAAGYQIIFGVSRPLFESNGRFKTLTWIIEACGHKSSKK